LKRREVAFADVAALEVKRERTLVRNRYTYRCGIVAHVRDPVTAAAQAVPLVTTRSFRDDPDTPYRMALPLVTELAAALGVERRLN
jgi:hypothetical protein